MPVAPEEGVLMRFDCGCDRCITRGGGLYFFYGTEAPVFSFPLMESEQKGRAMLVGMVEAREVDAISYVPSLDETMSYGDLSQDLYDRSSDRWQRSLDPERQRMIGEFWRIVETPQNDIQFTKQGHISNNIVLSYTTDGFEAQEEDGPRTLELPTWFSDYCSTCQQPVDQLLQNLPDDDMNITPQIEERIEQLGEEAAGWRIFADFCPNVECPRHSGNTGLSGGRPIEIIDGQHRTRGINHQNNAQFENLASYGYCTSGAHRSAEDCLQGCGEGHWLEMAPPTREKIPISITVFTDEQQEEAEKARIFVDINTRAEGLNPTHKLTMLWRHSVRDGKIFSGSGQGDWNESDLDFSHDNYRQSLVYRLILEMSREGGQYNQTKGMLPPISNKEGEKNIISIRELRDLLLEWMEPNKIFSGFTAAVMAPHYARALDNYLCAWAWCLSHPLQTPDDSGEVTNVPQWMNAASARYWSPSHRDYGPTNPGHNRTPAGPGRHRVDTIEDGYIQNPLNKADPARSSIGEVSQTPELQIIFRLFPPVTKTLLMRACDRDGNDWEDDFLGNQYSVSTKNIELTEAAYRVEIDRFTQGYTFGRSPLTHNQLNSKNQKSDFIEIACDRLGWVM